VWPRRCGQPPTRIFTTRCPRRGSSDWTSRLT
jgi:hypothetical protein